MGSKTEVTVKVDLDLIRDQRDAVLRDIEKAPAGRYWNAEHVELLDGLVSMLDWMLDQGEELMPDGIAEPWPIRDVLPELKAYYENDGSD